MSGNTSRNKGARWERDCVRYLVEQGVLHAERAPGGHEQPSGDILGLPGVHLECKAHERATLVAWLDTAHAQASRRGALAVVLVRVRGRPNPADSLAVLRVDALLDLLRAAGLAPPPIIVDTQARL